MRLGTPAAIIALFYLTGCDAFRSPQAGVEACVGRFEEMFRGFRDVRPSSGGTVRYAFELRNADPALQREGIEGVPPNRFTSLGDAGSQAETRDAVDRLMSEEPYPKTIPGPSVDYVMGATSWLVYAPARSFSRAEAMRHLAAMCALSSRGAILDGVHVNL